MEVWQDFKLFRMVLICVLDNVSKAMPSYWVQRSVSTNTLTRFKLEAIEVVIENFVLKQMHRWIVLNKVIPDFNDIVIVVNVSINKSIKAWFKSSYKLTKA